MQNIAKLIVKIENGEEMIEQLDVLTSMSQNLTDNK